MAHQGQTVHNPRTGQSMTFVELSEAVMRCETVNPPSDEREPTHVHPLQESGAEVQVGTLWFEVDGQRRAVGPGESITVPAGAPHRFWNEGPQDARAVQYFRPGLDTAAFFECFFALAQRDELTRDGSPRFMQLMVMVPEFGDEIRPTSPPWPVLRTLTAVLGPLARARGYEARPGGS